MARRLVAGAVALLVVAAGVAGLLAFFTSRDSSTTSGAGGPGTFVPALGRRPARIAPVARDGRALTPDQTQTALQQGNVVLAYGGARAPAALRNLAREEAGAPFSGALAAAGQAVILARHPGAPGVTALAWRHELHTASPGDPALRRFTEFWLGQGPQG